MFGSHLSIAGGMHNALLEAERLGMGSVQVFTKNQQQWKCKPLDATAVGDWCSNCQRLNFSHAVSHDSYLINLASPDEKLWEMSTQLFIEEVRRCQMLRIPYLVTHPGAHMGAGEAEGIARIVAALDVVHEATRGRGVTTCLEITAGQGTSLGCKLEHLGEIIQRVKRRSRVGVCIDTAHALAAGYDFRGRKYKAFRKQLDEIVGLDRVKVLHLNDSKKDLGSRVDRHEHIGKGFVGLDGFRPIVRDAAFADIPKILETPKGKDEAGREWDTVNLEVLKGLMR